MTTDQRYPNGAYTQQYADNLKQYDPLFDKQHLLEKEEQPLEEYTLLGEKYRAEIKDCNLAGAIYTLLDAERNAVHQWRCYDDSADFAELIQHANGKRYLIYREDLYGYSVYDFANKEHFQYYPLGLLEIAEDFIWTGVHYHPQSNLLAVDGCMWACPWSVLISDFEDPMQPPRFQKDVFGYLKGGYEVYDDATFVRWEADRIVVKCENFVDNQVETLEIETQLLKQ